MEPLQEAIVGDSRTGLWFLLSAVLGLTLMACVNLANAQLGRAMVRSRDGAVRAALGAARWRLVWNAVTENLLLVPQGWASDVERSGFMETTFFQRSQVARPMERYITASSAT